MSASDGAESASPTVAEILAKLGTDRKTGLNPGQLQERLSEYGPNALPEEKKTALSAFLAYFWGPIPWMIEAAALIALIVGDWRDLTIITSLLLFNALLGFWEEHEASNALDALKNSLALKARVLRSGKSEQVDARTLVPGDIVRLYLGDVVPGDCELIQGDYISIDQSALTGESLPVKKKSGDDAYSGSVVKEGEMVAVITATGVNTFFGRTAKLVAGAGSVSHFQRAVMKIGNFLIILALVLVVIVVASRLFDMRGHYDRVVLLRLAEIVLILLVASVPVAMPAVLSVTMALGARLLARSKAIVSRLESIEELAGVDVLCSDKTGTLTQNKLTLSEAQPWAGTDAATLILMASLASRVADNDPIDLAVMAGLKVARSYSKLWSALPGGYTSPSRPATTADHDVSTTCSRWSPDVIRDSHPGSALWKPPYPNAKLFFAIVVTQIAAMFMCSQGWLVPTLPWKIIGFVWAYNLIWMIVQDVAKLAPYRILDPAYSWERSLFQPLRVSMTRGPEPVR